MVKRYGTPGPRALYPSICTSLTLSRCDPMAQLLFDRMLTQADDQGRLPAAPPVVKALCVPLVHAATAKTIARWMDQLSRHGMLLLYQVDDETYAQFPEWWEYQAGMKKSYPSRFPAPPGWTDQVRGLGEDVPPPQGTSGEKFPPNPPPARAPSAEPNRTEPNPPQPPRDSDPLDTYNLLTSRVPSKDVMDWLERLASEHGQDLTSRTMAQVWSSDPTLRTFLGRVETALASKARQDAKAESDRRRQADLDHERQERERIANATPEEQARAAKVRQGIKDFLGAVS